jgi:hypothetical protein
MPSHSMYRFRQADLLYVRRRAYRLGNPGYGQSGAVQYVCCRGIYYAYFLRLLENDHVPYYYRAAAGLADHQYSRRMGSGLVPVFNRFIAVTGQTPIRNYLHARSWFWWKYLNA